MVNHIDWRTVRVSHWGRVVLQGAVLDLLGSRLFSTKFVAGARPSRGPRRRLAGAVRKNLRINTRRGSGRRGRRWAVIIGISQRTTGEDADAGGGSEPRKATEAVDVLDVVVRIPPMEGAAAPRRRASALGPRRHDVIVLIVRHGLAVVAIVEGGDAVLQLEIGAGGGATTG